MKKLLFVAGIASAVLATPAVAEDTAAPTGARVEALIGYDHVSVGGFDKGGALFGLGAGYDFAINNSVALGLDGEVSDSTTKFGDAQSGRDLYVGGRVSYALNPKANLYLKAGYTNARIIVDDSGANGDGFRVGLGGQLIVGGKAYVGAEYRYSNYEGDFSRHQVAATIGTRF